MKILNETKEFFKPVKVANVTKVMSVEVWFVLNIVLSFAMILFFYWHKPTDVSIFLGGVFSCLIIPRFLAGILGVEK